MQDAFSQPHLGAFFAPQKPGFAGVRNCRNAAIPSGVLPEAKFHAWIQAVDPNVEFATVPLQFLPQISAPQGVNIIPMIDTLP
jgi:hypothetical protein